jgi:hypothetical protein
VYLKGQLRLLGRKELRRQNWEKETWIPLLPQGDSTPITLASLPFWALASQAAGNVTT